MSADRHSSYKSLAKAGALQIAFCWAHVRRDFILLAKEREVHQGWAEQWLAGIAEVPADVVAPAGIAELYRWHRRRQQALVRERSDRHGWSWSGPRRALPIIGMHEWEGRHGVGASMSTTTSVIATGSADTGGTRRERLGSPYRANWAHRRQVRQSQ